MKTANCSVSCHRNSKQNTILELAAITLACSVSWAAFSTINAAPMTRAEVADWAQGLGTIAAVGVAAWALSYPAKVERLRIARQRVEFMNDAWRTMQEVHMVIDSIRSAALERDVGKAAAAAENIIGAAPLGTVEHMLKEPISAFPTVTLHTRCLTYLAHVRALDRFKIVPAKGPQAQKIWWEKLDIALKREHDGFEGLYRVVDMTRSAPTLNPDYHRYG